MAIVLFNLSIIMSIEFGFVDECNEERDNVIRKTLCELHALRVRIILMKLEFDCYNKFSNLNKNRQGQG